MDDMHTKVDELQEKAHDVAENVKGELHEAHGKADQWMKERKDDMKDMKEEMDETQ